MYPGSQRYQIGRTGWSIWCRIHGHWLRNTLPGPVVVPLCGRELDTITVEFVGIGWCCYQEVRAEKKLTCRPKIDIDWVMIARCIWKLKKKRSFNRQTSARCFFGQCVEIRH